MPRNRYRHKSSDGCTSSLHLLKRLQLLSTVQAHDVERDTRTRAALVWLLHHCLRRHAGARSLLIQRVNQSGWVLSYDSLPTLRQNPAKGWGSHKEYSEGKHGPAPGGTTKGKEFLNSAAQLPAKAAGYYREFTVPVAGQAGRGAARLVTGAGGEIYYTADHYVTFTRIK